MNPDAVADTHALIWLYFDPVRLSTKTLTALDSATRYGRLLASAISLAEIVYLEERMRLPYHGVFTRLATLAADPSGPVTVIPVTVDVIAAMRGIPRNEVPDLPDRVAASTAIVAGLPLVSADAKVRASSAVTALVPVLW